LKESKCGSRFNLLSYRRPVGDPLVRAGISASLCAFTDFQPARPNSIESGRAGFFYAVRFV
jgi:hypothetical protein